jgi:polyhydroxyalkanoate synthesis regulator phasin
MAQTDTLKRYLDAGIAFTAMTQSRAEAIVKDLVKAGEVQSEAAQATVLDLVDRSRKNTEKLLSQVRAEVRDQVKNLGLATQADIDRLERKISAIGAPAKKVAARKAPAKKAAAKKAPARKTAAKKAPARKAAAKKA